MRKHIRWLLVGGVAMLLALGLAGPIQRAIVRYGSSTNAGLKVAAPAQDPFAIPRRELMEKRASIVAEVRGQQMAGDHAAVLKLAGRYFPLGDAELNELYRVSAEHQSARMRLDQYRGLVASQCVEITARLATVQFLRNFVVEGDSDSAVHDLHLARLEAGEARAAVIRQWQEAATRAAAAHISSPGANPVDRAHAQHQPRVHPDFIAGLTREPGDAGLLCAWRAEGRIAGTARSRNFSLTFWMAPNVPGTALEFDPLRWTER